MNTNYQNYELALHLLVIGGLFGKYFRPDDVPNDEFKASFLRAYHEQSNRMNNVRMTDEQLDEFIKIELIKVLNVMLSIRILMIQRALFHNYLFPGKMSKECVKDYCFALYDDYIKHKDDHLRLLKSLEIKWIFDTLFIRRFWFLIHWI